MRLLVFILLFTLNIRLAIPESHVPPVPKQDPRIEKEINCLAENVYYEARGEPVAGQYAVAEVTMNRVSAPGFPATVCGVVHQKAKGTCQFSWVCWKGRPAVRKDDQAWLDSYEIAKQVATNMLTSSRRSGIITKRNALYYHANYVNPYWAKSKKYVTKIGQHVFYAEVSGHRA